LIYIKQGLGFSNVVFVWHRSPALGDVIKSRLEPAPGQSSRDFSFNMRRAWPVFPTRALRRMSASRGKAEVNFSEPSLLIVVARKQCAKNTLNHFLYRLVPATVASTCVFQIDESRDGNFISVRRIQFRDF
jgi:hypothetical protein